jgi:hypothetical protein
VQDGRPAAQTDAVFVGCRAPFRAFRAAHRWPRVGSSGCGPSESRRGPFTPAFRRDIHAATRRLAAGHRDAAAAPLD